MQFQGAIKYRIRVWWELGQVMMTWLRREGSLFGLLIAWWQVITGQVIVE